MPDPAPKAIFLSYARDDVAAARRIAEALRGAGLEVWFDENELTGGDAWDQKIRTQIGECALFVPVISANTEARLEGYFRLEWRLAEQRSHLMAKGKRFLVPVCIDETREKGAQVPDAFLEVQWTRLAAGVATAQFVELVKRLLIPLEPGRPRPGERGEGAASPAMQPEVGRRVPAVAWSGAVAVVGIGIAVTFFATRKTETPPATSPPNAGAGTRPPTTERSDAPAPVSEVRKLVEQARKLYGPWDLASQEDFLLAEKLLKKAVDLDPADGEAWAAYAIMTLGSLNNFGSSDELVAQARTFAERAIKFAPESGTARLARAFTLRYSRQTADEAERLLREEATRQPTNQLALRTLGATLINRGQSEQALVYLGRSAALPGGDAIAHYLRSRAYEQMGRIPEADAALDDALAIAPAYVKAHAYKLALLLAYHGDVSRAKAHLANVPPSYLTDGNGAAMAGLVWLYARDARRCLDVLRNAREFPQVNAFVGYSGPKAYLAGLAHAMAGNADAARTEWRAALRAVEQRLAAQPNAPDLLVWKTVLLAALGQGADVDPLLAELKQRQATGAGGVGHFDFAQVYVLLQRPAEAIAALEFVMRTPNKFVWRNQLRYDPVWDPLRGDPRFEALLTVPETAQKK